MGQENQNDLTILLKQIARQEREASKPCSFYIGEVVGIKPLRVKLSQKLTVDKDFCYVCECVKDVKKGDSVAVLRAQGGQKFLILDKVV